MSLYVDGPVRSFAVSSALSQHRRVKLSSGVLAYAGATDRELGTLETPVVSGDETAAVRLRTAPGTQRMIASEAVTEGSAVYAAADGRVAASGTIQVGTTLTAATADGDVIEVLRTALDTSVSPDVASVEAFTANDTLTAAESGKVCTNAGASGAVTLTLPDDPAVGTYFDFIVQTAQTFAIDPPTGDQLIVAGATQAAGKSISADDEGETLRLTYVGSNKWLASVLVGTWTVES